MVPFTVAIQGDAVMSMVWRMPRRLLGKVQVPCHGVNSCLVLSTRAGLATEPTVARVQLTQKQLERHFFLYM